MPNIYKGLYRGLSDSKYSGIIDSFATLIGIDGHSTPGILKVHQALVKDSGTTVDAFVKVRIAASDGSTLWFSSTTGKIWRRTSAGVWSLVHTTTPAVGGVGCLGAEEFDGFIYWATESRLHRKATTDLSNWADAVEDWATFTNTDDSFHPMQKQNLQLYIGDANYLAKVSGDTGSHVFTAKDLDIKQPLRIKTLIDFDIDVLIGTYVDDNVNKTEVLRYDTESTSWTVSDTIEENGINAFIRDDNFVYVQAGKFGRIYFYNGKDLIPDKRIPGDYSPTKTAVVHPQAVSTYLTIPVFGLSNDAGNPANQGVYRLGSYSKDYPKVMDLSFVISPNKVASIEIGVVLAVGGNLFVSWKDGSTYGVDKLDYSVKYTSAYIETMVLTFSQTRGILDSIKNILVNYASILPASTAVVMKYKKAYEISWTTITSITDTKLVQERAKITIPEVASLQLRFEFTVNGNNSPEIEGISYSTNLLK